MRKENPNALATNAQVGAPTSARNPTINPVVRDVTENMPALLIGGCADSCLFLTAGCPVASVDRLQPRGRRHEPIGLLLQKASELLSPLLLGKLLCRFPLKAAGCPRCSLPRRAMDVSPSGGAGKPPAPGRSGPKSPPGSVPRGAWAHLRAPASWRKARDEISLGDSGPPPPSSRSLLPWSSLSLQLPSGIKVFL